MTRQPRARARALAAGLSATLACAGCVHAPDRAQGYGTGAPRQSDVADVGVHGFRARIRFSDGTVAVGELLVAEPDGVVTVRTREHGDQTRATAEVRRATIRTDPRRGAWIGAAGGVTGAAALATIATGFLMIYFTPIVLAGGAVAMGVLAAESQVVLRRDELRYLYQYARWPQGRPQPAPEPLVDDGVIRPIR